MFCTKIFRVLLLCLLWSVVSVLTYAYITERLRIKLFRFSKAEQSNSIIQSDATHRFNTRNSLLTTSEFAQRIFGGTTQNQPTKTYKSILLWDEVWWFKQTEIKSDFCGFCPITRNRSLVYNKDTAAVVVNVWSKTPSNPPIDKRRRPDQLYVFWATESPGKTRFYGKYEVKLDLYPPHYFNATMSYRRDSTFYQPIQRQDVVNIIRKSWHGVEKNTEKVLAIKDKTAVLIASNCDYGSYAVERLKLAQEMVDLGFKVDRFGRCFPQNKFPLPKKLRESPEFFRVLEKYKFYLAFENSLHCRDYITEKFWTHGLTAGLLPVVAGATKEDYLAIAPPKSFVHVEDFDSTSELVKYLKYLDRNQTAYAEYFRWRSGSAEEYYRFGKAKEFCALCRALHGIPVDEMRSYKDLYATLEGKTDSDVLQHVSQTIPDIHKWWHVDESKECLNVTRKKGR